MNYELAFRNLDQIRQLLDEGKQYEACTTLLALGSLLVQGEDVHSMQPIMLLGQYSKVSRQLLAMYDTLMKTFSPENELKQYEIRLQNVNHDLQQVQDEYSALEAQNAELLAQEKALQGSKKELEELIARVVELTELKDNELQQLKCKRQSLQEALERLNAEVETAKSSLERYQSELSEDGRLIRNLPDRYGTVQSVDELIARLKEQEDQAQNLHSAYEQGLTAFIDQIRISYENL